MIRGLATKWFFLAIFMQLLFPSEGWSQKRAVLEQSQQTALLELAKELETDFKIKQTRAIERAKKEGLPIRQELEDGTIYELISYEGNVPEYRMTFNLGAARSTSTDRVHPGGRSGHDLAGRGMIVGEWDGGATLLTHQEFGGRAIQRDNATSLSSHATHVAGTLIAAGVRPEAKGMAPEAILWTHDWNNDDAEMAAAAAQGLLISNHSYGTITGFARGDWANPGTQEWHWWGDPNVDEQEDFKFGWYNSGARSWDQIAFNAPHYLIVKSAGNDRSDAGSLNHQVRIGGSWTSSNVQRQRDGGPDGFDCIPTSGNAKNILTIGAVNKINNGWTRPQDVVMSSFSGWGPTDDGRIKPDLVGAGVGLLSSNSSGNAGYNSSSGTSMSGPNVAGSLILLQELYEKLFGTFMRAATLKGLAIHTADEAGANPGPDYRFGWGMLNTEKAADLIADPLRNTLLELELTNGDTFEHTIYADGETDIKLTLSWTDPAAPASPAILNDRTLKLINDLDMVLISVEDEELRFHPYILDPANPNAAASTGDNFRDNVEQIHAGILPKGEYTVRISHKGSLQGGSQSFSMIISAPIAECLLSVENNMILDVNCPDDIIESLVIEPSEGVAPFVYALGAGEFQEENEFFNLLPGSYIAFIKDSLGCIGTQNIRVQSPDPIEVIFQERFVFNTSNDGLPSENLVFSSSTQSGWGGSIEGQLLEGKLVLVNDGSNDPLLGCNPLVNGEEIAGNIAVVNRGSCEFGRKALRAQQAGARAVIILNNDSGTIAMGAGADGGSVDIPAFMISNSDGQNLLDYIAQNDNPMFVMGTYIPIRPESCAGRGDGFVGPIITGGRGPYTFFWSHGEENLSFEGAAGTYSLLIEDQFGCSANIEIEIPAIQRPTPQMIIRSESCFGDEDGFARLVNVNAFSGYALAFSNGITTPIAENLPAGEYVLELTAQDECVVSRPFTIEAGADIPRPEILGSPDVTQEGSYLFTTKILEEIDEFIWTVIGGNIVEGQGSREVLVQVNENAEELEVRLAVRKDRCTKRDTVVLEVMTVSTQEPIWNQYVKMYPNPANQNLFLEINQDILSGMEFIHIYDMKGRLLKQEVAGSRVDIPIGDLVPGMYVIRIGNMHARFVKQ